MWEWNNNVHLSALDHINETVHMEILQKKHVVSVFLELPLIDVSNYWVINTFVHQEEQRNASVTLFISAFRCFLVGEEVFYPSTRTKEYFQQRARARESYMWIIWCSWRNFSWWTSPGQDDLTGGGGLWMCLWGVMKQSAGCPWGIWGAYQEDGGCSPSFLFQNVGHFPSSGDFPRIFSHTSQNLY